MLRFGSVLALNHSASRPSVEKVAGGDIVRGTAIR
jgi:hypothetical protein